MKTRRLRLKKSKSRRRRGGAQGEGGVTESEGAETRTGNQGEGAGTRTISEGAVETQINEAAQTVESAVGQREATLAIATARVNEVGQGNRNNASRVAAEQERIAAEQALEQAKAAEAEVKAAVQAEAAARTAGNPEEAAKAAAQAEAAAKAVANAEALAAGPRSNSLATQNANLKSKFVKYQQIFAGISKLIEDSKILNKP